MQKIKAPFLGAFLCGRIISYVTVFLSIKGLTTAIAIENKSQMIPDIGAGKIQAIIPSMRYKTLDMSIITRPHTKLRHITTIPIVRDTGLETKSKTKPKTEIMTA